MDRDDILDKAMLLLKEDEERQMYQTACPVKFTIKITIWVVEQQWHTISQSLTQLTNAINMFDELLTILHEKKDDFNANIVLVREIGLDFIGYSNTPRKARIMRMLSPSADVKQELIQQADIITELKHYKGKAFKVGIQALAVRRRREYTIEDYFKNTRNQIYREYHSYDITLRYDQLAN